MNHLEFGVLVASLREDMRWTQAELAERSELSLAIVNGIERGENRALLADDALLQLANGLQLTTLERREFMLAASDVTDKDLLRPDIGSPGRSFDIETFLLELGRDISVLRLPVFVTDAFCDILLANHCAVAFYDPPASLVGESSRMVGGFNQIQLVFHRDSNFRQLVGEDDWDRLALINIRHFRRRTMRFRHKSYYSALMKQFLNTRKYPYFERYWRKVAFEISDDFSVPIASANARNKHAFVETESLIALTPHGELYLHQLLPVNKATSRRVTGILNRVGSGFTQFAPLPDRRKQ